VHRDLARAALTAKLDSNVHGAIYGRHSLVQLFHQISNHWGGATDLPKDRPGHIAEHSVEGLAAGETD
jgi:hypothetical protein